MPLNFIHLHLLFPLQLCHPQKHLQVIVITLTLILCYTYFPSKSPNPNPGRARPTTQVVHFWYLLWWLSYIYANFQIPSLYIWKGPERMHGLGLSVNKIIWRLSSLVNYDDLFPVCLFNFTPTHGHSRPHHRCLRSLRSTKYRPFTKPHCQYCIPCSRPLGRKLTTQKPVSAGAEEIGNESRICLMSWERAVSCS